MQDSADNESNGAVELRSSCARQPKKPHRGDLAEPGTAIGDGAVKNVGTGTTTPATITAGIVALPQSPLEPVKLSLADDAPATMTGKNLLAESAVPKQKRYPSTGHTNHSEVPGYCTRPLGVLREKTEGC